MKVKKKTHKKKNYNMFLSLLVSVAEHWSAEMFPCWMDGWVRPQAFGFFFISSMSASTISFTSSSKVTFGFQPSF